MDESQRMTTRPRRGAALAFVSAGFVLLAVTLEVVGGAFANSRVPAWTENVVPLGWPAPARVAWWLLVAAAAALFRRELHRQGVPQRPWVVVLTVVPFVVFALGIALGADWATWH